MKDLQDMLDVLGDHKVNFTVNHFVGRAKVLVRQTDVWKPDALLSRPVFQALCAAGFRPEQVKHRNEHGLSGTPAATVEYVVEVMG